MKIDIETIKRKLLIKYPFFGSVLANVEFIEKNEVSTAGTDGKKIYYSPDFLNKLSIEEVLFIFAHELCHIAFDHVYRSEGKDKEIWNIATDSVINALLKKDGLPLVSGGVDIEEAINYNAEEMYSKLINEKKNQQNNNQVAQNNSTQNGSTQHENDGSQNSETSENKSNSNDGNQNSKSDVGHDTHSMWEDAIVERKKEQNIREEKNNETEQSNNFQNEDENLVEKIIKKIKQLTGNNNEQNQVDNQEKNNEPDNTETIKKLTEMGEREAFSQNKVERKKQLEELRQSLAEQSFGVGNGSNGDVRKVTDIGVAEQLIDWRRILKEAVQYDLDWSYQNATIEDGVLTPYLEEKPFPETEIVLDTSGSIDEKLLRNFLRECKNILQSSKVKVGCFDDRFYGFTEIRNEPDIDKMEFIGGGGTNFDAAVEAFSRRVENKIIFTDGRSYMPEKPIDAIWIVFGGYKINPKGGKVIYIDEEYLNKLGNKGSRRL